MNNLDSYLDIVGDRVIHSIYKKMRSLYDSHVLHINSTFSGGGVAEILASLVPLMNDIGIDAGWRILHGNTDFFGITKKFHNGLQGEPVNVSDIKKHLYAQASQEFSTYTHINAHDYVIVHDPQPLPLVKYYRKRQPWIWRCHIDLSSPDQKLWSYLKRYMLNYDMVIVSSEMYMSKDLPVEYRIIMPAINPLTHKNKVIPDSLIEKTFKKHNIPTDKPFITQISRFDKWKDPLGVLDVFRLVREKIDCRLVLCGNMAADDPEGWEIYEEVRRKAKPFTDSGDVILVTIESNILVNALQRKAAVVVQKSLREGFGLTVTEALWKARPVVASNVGGIPLQIRDGENGYLLDPEDTQGFADRIVEIIKHPDHAQEMGQSARETVRDQFLMTRVLSDYLDLLNYLS